MEIQQLEKNVQINAAVIWLLSLLLIYPFLLLITSPLKRLSLQMAKTGEGDFTTQIHELPCGLSVPQTWPCAGDRWTNPQSTSP